MYAQGAGSTKKPGRPKVREPSSWGWSSAERKPKSMLCAQGTGAATKAKRTCDAQAAVAKKRGPKVRSMGCLLSE